MERIVACRAADTFWRCLGCLTKPYDRKCKRHPVSGHRSVGRAFGSGSCRFARGEFAGGGRCRAGQGSWHSGSALPRVQRRRRGISIGCFAPENQISVGATFKKSCLLCRSCGALSDAADRPTDRSLLRSWQPAALRCRTALHLDCPTLVPAPPAWGLSGAAALPARRAAPEAGSAPAVVSCAG
jgi:hypothetical protein